MFTRFSPLLIALAWSLAGAAAQAQGWGLPSVKVHFNFRVDIRSQSEPQPSAPWWAYFPQDRLAAAQARSAYPHWPTQFPPSEDPTVFRRQSTPGANVVFGPAPTAVQPAGFLQGAPPSYWHQR